MTTLSPDRIDAARELAGVFSPGQRVCLTTHVNPDGDGLGSEVGLAHLLRAKGCEVTVTNPSPTPERYNFLFHDLPGVDRSDAAVKELRKSDLIVVRHGPPTGPLVQFPALEEALKPVRGFLMTYSAGVDRTRNRAWRPLPTTGAPTAATLPPLAGDVLDYLGQRAQEDEADEARVGQLAVRAAGGDHVGATVAKQPHALAERLAAGGAG